MPLLDGKRVAADVIDPAKHRYIGSFRTPQPPDTKYTKEDGTIGYSAVLVCGCGAHLWTMEGVHDHWLLGHMDQPQYVSL